MNEFLEFSIEEVILNCDLSVLKSITVCIITEVGSAEGLAFDKAYQELYWTSYTDSTISRIRLNKENALREKIVQLGDEDHPRAIVIDSCDS